MPNSVPCRVQLTESIGFGGRRNGIVETADGGLGGRRQGRVVGDRGYWGGMPLHQRVVLADEIYAIVSIMEKR